VQAEVSRREREIDTTLRQTAEVRRFADQFSQTIAPYEAMLRSENAHPLAAMGELFKTAAVLRNAPAPERAARVADMIMQFGIDFNMLDEALASRVQNGGQQRQPQQQMPDVSALVAQEFAKRETTQLSSAAAQTWQQFASDPLNEFAEDLRQDMADLLEMSARRGQTLSLSEAYRRATLAHPTIAGIVSNRQQTQSAAQQTAAAKRAKDAAASVSSGGAPSRGGETEDESSDIRSAMQASIRQLSNAR
jgi:hypothetical protein